MCWSLMQSPCTGKETAGEMSAAIFRLMEEALSLSLRKMGQPQNRFGFALLESLIITVTTALRLQAYSLGALTEGNIPEGFVELPRDIASSRDQVKEWQGAWGALLSGGPRFPGE